MKRLNTTLGLALLSAAAWCSPSLADEPPVGQQPAQSPSRDGAPTQGTSDQPPMPIKHGDAPAEADQPAGQPQSIEVMRDVVFTHFAGADGQPQPLAMDVAYPSEAGDKPLPAVVYIHGGGWQAGSKRDGTAFVAAFAAGGYFAASIDYRLSGQAVYPAAIHDCKAAIRFLRAHAQDLGIDPGRIGVWGHSAGGHLASMLGVTGDEKEFEGSLEPTGVSSAVKCVVSVCGPADLRMALRGSADGIVGKWLGGDPAAKLREATQASPVVHVNQGDASFLLVHGSLDELIGVEQARNFDRTLREATVPVKLHIVEGAGHAITDREAYRTIAAFFDEQLGGNVTAMARDLARRQAGDAPPQRMRPTRGTPPSTPPQRDIPPAPR